MSFVPRQLLEREAEGEVVATAWGGRARDVQRLGVVVEEVVYPCPETNVIAPGDARMEAGEGEALMLHGEVILEVGIVLSGLYAARPT